MRSDVASYSQPWLRMSTHALLALTEHLQGLTVSGSTVLTLIISFIVHLTAAVSIRAKDEPLESARFPLLLAHWVQANEYIMCNDRFPTM